MKKLGNITFSFIKINIIFVMLTSKIIANNKLFILAPESGVPTLNGFGCKPSFDGAMFIYKMSEKKLLKKYNFLTPVKKVSYNEKSRTWNWLFKCDCGKEKIINIQQVRNNSTKSCGCFKNKNLKNGFGQAHNNWKGKTPIPKTYISSVNKRAISKGLDYNISDEYLWNLYIKQERKCNLSGININISYSKQTASIDRIDCTKGYIEGNVQWVHKDVNYIKYNLSEKDLIFICNKIRIKHEIKNK